MEQDFGSPTKVQSGSDGASGRLAKPTSVPVMIGCGHVIWNGPSFEALSARKMRAVRSSAMKRRRLRPTETLEQRLSEEAKRFREEAEGTPPGIARDALLRKARQAETGSHISEWLRSPGLQPPKGWAR